MQLCVFRAIILVTAMLGTTTLVRAHAYVVSSEPAASATIDRGPRVVSVTYDEPVALEATDPIVVRDEHDNLVACKPSAHIDSADATRVVCGFARALSRGRYTVSWRITSADTHVVHGAFEFGVGVGVGVVADVAPRSVRSWFDPSSPPSQMLRFLTLLGSLVATGALLFRREVAIPTQIGGDRAERRCTWVVAIGLAVAFAASFPALLVQTVAGAGAFPADPLVAMRATAIHTQWGHAWILRVAALFVLATAMLRNSVATSIASIAATLALLASFSASGHALDSANARLVLANTIADVVHLGAAATWIGGIVAFVVTYPRLNVRHAIAAYSPFAFAAAISIVLSGTYAAVVHVGSFIDLFDDTYGLLVVAKIVLLIPLVALGARNLSRGARRLAVTGFAREIGTETVLLTLIVALSAILTTVAPPMKTMPQMHGMHD